MDLNQLLFQHQRALIRYAADRASDRNGYQFDLVQHYERRIRRLRRELGVVGYPSWV